MSKRTEYNTRFQNRYGMTQTEWRKLKKENLQKANELREKAQKSFVNNIVVKKRD